MDMRRELFGLKNKPALRKTDVLLDTRLRSQVGLTDQLEDGFPEL